MQVSSEVVNHPVALISVALAAVFAFGAKRPGQNAPPWWPAACYSLAFVVVVGGFILAWPRSSVPAMATSSPVAASAVNPSPAPTASEPTGGQSLVVGKIDNSKVTATQSAASGASKPIKQEIKASDVNDAVVDFNQNQ